MASSLAKFFFVSSGINDQNIHSPRPPRSLLRFFWSHPHFYRQYAKWRHGIDIFRLPHHLIFDGFPRSGNTFGSRMLAVTQKDQIKILSNAHCPPYILGALHGGKPVCLTLRCPKEAVASWVILKRKLPVDVVLKLYIDFYKVLLPYRSRVLVLPFTVITQDFATVLRLINQRFGLNLARFDDLAECEKETFSRIDLHYKNKPEGYDPLAVARPHPEREELKAEVLRKIESPKYAKLLQECNDLYEIFHAEYQNALIKIGESAQLAFDRAGY